MSFKLKSFTILFVLMSLFNCNNCHSNDYSDCFGYCLQRLRQKSRLIRDCIEECEQYYFYEEEYTPYDTPDYRYNAIHNLGEKVPQKPKVDNILTKDRPISDKNNNYGKPNTMIKLSDTDLDQNISRSLLDYGRKIALVNYIDKSATNKISLKSLSNFQKIAQPSHCGYKSKQDIHNLAVFGSRGKTLGRIIGGTDADPFDFPWMVSLLEKPKNHPLWHFCGGAVISDRFILTAAHCQLERFIKNHNNLIIKIGVNSYKEKSAQNLTIDRIYIHVQYDNKKQLNDIALIKVKETIKFTTDNLGRFMVNVVCLPDTPNELTGIAVLAGWGRYHLNKTSHSEWLQKVTVPIVEREKCTQLFQDYFEEKKQTSIIIGDSQICAGGVGGKGGCTGDSGGPLIQIRNNKAYHIGICSFTLIPNCAKSGIPTVYSNTIYFMDWIKEKMTN